MSWLSILTYILKTPQRRDEFAIVVRRLYPTETVHTVFVGYVTRWSSDYDSILRAFRLREAIEDYPRDTLPGGSGVLPKTWRVRVSGLRPMF